MTTSGPGGRVPEAPPPWVALPDSCGYLAAGIPVVCAPEHLVRLCARGPVPAAVWAPGTGGPVPPEELDFLLRVLRGRLMRRPLRTAALVAVLGATLVAQEATRTGLEPGSPAALYLALTTALVALALHAAWGAARLTPQGFRAMVADAERTRRLAARPVVHLGWMAGAMVLGTAAQVTALARAGGAAGVATFLSGAGELAVMPAAVWAEPVLARGEWDRLLTAAFVHGGILHFAVNFMALLVLGRDTERFAGRGLLPLVFLAAVLGGTGLGVALPPDVPSVGNSGGLVGVIAFLGILAWRRPDRVPPGFLRSVLVNVALLVGIGVAGYAYVDNAGHAGGGVAGALLGLALIPSSARRPGWEPGPALQRAGAAALLVLGAAALRTAWVVVSEGFG